MTPIEYLESLIAGQKMGSSIPVQVSELETLRLFILADQAASSLKKVVYKTPTVVVKCPNRNEKGACTRYYLHCNFPRCEKETP